MEKFLGKSFEVLAFLNLFNNSKICAFFSNELLKELGNKMPRKTIFWIRFFHIRTSVSKKQCTCNLPIFQGLKAFILRPIVGLPIEASTKATTNHCMFAALSSSLFGLFGWSSNLWSLCRCFSSWNCQKEAVFTNQIIIPKNKSLLSTYFISTEFI